MSSSSRRINLMLYILGLHHGGAERVVASLCRNLDAERYSVTVCWAHANGRIGEELTEQGFNVVGLPESEPGCSPYRRFLVLRRLMQELQIDVIHTHDTGCLADAVQCRLLGSGVKIVHSFHFGNYPERQKSHLWMERIFSRLAHRLVAVGHEQARSIRKSLRLAHSGLLVLPNGVESIDRDSGVERDSRKPEDTPGTILIGSLSTLTGQKGLFVLLDAISMLLQKGVDCQVAIAGDGPLKSELERRVQELQLDSVVSFLGWVDDAADSFLPSLDIFCQSSLWEANSIVLLEAMAAGLPIVTTDVGESRHVVEHETGGLVVEPGNASALADALARLACRPEERKEMGKRAREVYEQGYTVETMVGNYQRVYDAVLNT